MGEECTGSPLRLHCVFGIDDHFFAVVENERLEMITIVRLTKANFDFLRLHYHRLGSLTTGLVRMLEPRCP